MAGAGKRRQAKERQHRDETSSADKKSSSDNSPGPSPNTQPSPPTALDGNRDPAAPRQPAGDAGAQPATVAGSNRNVDIGARGASLMSGGGDFSQLPLRPTQQNRTGREVSIKLNTFNVVTYPSKPIYQYDVVVGNGLEKRGLIMKLWASSEVQQKLGPGWIFDGNRLAWSMEKKDLNLTVDLDAGRPAVAARPGREPRSNVHKVAIKCTKQIDFASLRAYLDRQLTNMNESVLEAINFLDHLMRQTPSTKYTVIKRNFFARGTQRTVLGGGVEAFKGVYASIRMVNTGPTTPAGLSVNVDVANTTFWTESKLINSALQFLGASDPNRLATMLGAGGRDRSMHLINMRKYRHVRVYDTHRPGGIEAAVKEPHCIEGFLNKTPRQCTFKDHEDRETNVEQYIRNTYNITLQFPNLPAVQTTKKNVILPMELLSIMPNQRYNSKLSDRQTSEMIKFAVTLPPERWNGVQHGMKMLDWGNDVYLARYGLQITSNPTVVKARLLNNPKVGFSGGKQEDPKTSGRWRIDGKVFAGPHATELKSWGISVSPGRFSADKNQVQMFVKTFINVFTGHGGKITNKDPIILQGSQEPNKDVETLYNSVGKANNMTPQLLVFIVPDKDTTRYLRLKRSCDCRYGVVSQVLQSTHVQKNQGQYCSNVSMKVNAKLGGFSFKALGSTPAFTKPTMIIGADVSHGAPGTAAASVAAITISWDREAIRYAATVQTNGIRVEMITKTTIETMVKPLVTRWIAAISKGATPQHVLYFRDGVSEGQYEHVLNQEVADLRAMFKSINPNANIDFTVVVCSKRHHVRFFPEKGSGDRNDNPQPGTLVETGVTHPFEYDFYLNSHSAIKGTARPIHYHVIKDDAKMGVDKLQNMIYEHSYQYMRSTTPVSLHPAVYYAHLASNRAVAHIDPANISSEGGSDNARRDDDVPLLTPMNNQAGIRGVMWYI